MKNNDEIARELRKALEFYQSLGFEHLPLSSKTISMDVFVKGLDVNKEHISHVSEDALNNNYVSPVSKDQALKELRADIGDCQRCRLSKGRKSIVFGEGNPGADLMFIGEGPGREEDIQGRPFVGDAGKVLTSLIRKMGLRREDVYIANIIKCRPPSNRDPETDEMDSCGPFLEKQIEIIKPKIIVALGRISSQRLLGTMIPISKLRGKFYSYKDIPVMPTFHPAYLIRNPKDKWLTWEDAQKVMEKINKKL
jgi:uracil-DNA glycosylase family 4